MGRIAYTITSGELPITVNLMQGETIVDSNEHDDYGSYSFEGVAVANYTIEFYEYPSFLCGVANITPCLDCPDGFAPVGDKCIKYNEETPTYSGSTYTILRKTGYTGYGISGTALFSGWDSDGTGTYELLTNTYWKNVPHNYTDGAMNRTCVWASTTTTTF